MEVVALGVTGIFCKLEKILKQQIEKKMRECAAAECYLASGSVFGY